MFSYSAAPTTVRPPTSGFIIDDSSKGEGHWRRRWGSSLDTYPSQIIEKLICFLKYIATISPPQYFGSLHIFDKPVEKDQNGLVTLKHSSSIAFILNVLVFTCLTKALATNIGT